MLKRDDGITSGRKTHSFGLNETEQTPATTWFGTNSGATDLFCATLEIYDDAAENDYGTHEEGPRARNQSPPPSHFGIRTDMGKAPIHSTFQLA